MIFVDTNVFIIDLRYRRDKNFRTNKLFLSRMADSGRGVTSIYNLLEVCGILSFNLNRQQLAELFYYLPSRYNVEILPVHEADVPLPETRVGSILDVIVKRASFGDAVIAHFVEKNLSDDAVFVSWDASHFRELLSIKTITPDEFLA